MLRLAFCLWHPPARPTSASANTAATTRCCASAPYAFEGGKTLNLTVGIGSSAFRHQDDPPNVMWTLGDRGPNIACSECKELTGVELGCGEVKGGRVYPTPSYAPSIYRVLLLDDGTSASPTSSR